MTIACMPIDIDISLPDEQRILDYVNTYRIPGMLDYDTCRFEEWAVAPIMGPIPSKDWKDVSKVRNLMFNRQNPNYGGAIEYANDFDKLFPEVADMIKQIPILNPTCIFLKQNKEASPHTDMHGADDVKPIPELWNLSNEPRRYNIQMTKFDYQSFYVSKTKDSERIPYTHINKETPVYLFCEDHYYHGADYCGPDKINLCFAGILDWDKHVQLVQKSLKKHRDKAIIFEDDNDFLYN